MRDVLVFKKRVLLLFALIAFVLSGCWNQKEIMVSKLSCEYHENPINLNMEHPRFSWVLESDQRGQKQTAYQVLVSSDEQSLQQNIGDLWDSGKIESSQSVHIRYNGALLESNQTLFWKVRVWDKDGIESSYSKTARFTTAILQENEWQAKWIGKAFAPDPADERGYYASPVAVHANGDSTRVDERSLLLRKDLDIPKRIKKAIVHVTGLGYYEFSINGAKVGDFVLSPAKTLYTKSILYDTFDITEHLQEDKNTLGIIIGNGWFNPLKKRWNWRMQWFGDKRAFLQMHIEYADGTSEVIISDESWKFAPGPILSSCVYDGEIYDAREESPSWDKPGYDDSAWKSADVLNAPGGELEPQAMPAIQRTQILKPKAITNPKPGIYVFDLGQNFSGWIKLFVKGSRGDKVTLQYAENLRRDGQIDPTTNGSALVTDVYILGGNGDEVYEPRFTYHGFRYVQIEGFPGEPKLKNVQGIVVHTAVEPAGSFECSNEDFNRIHQATLWSQRSNLMGFPTDCPQRDERLGWFGDAHVTAEEAIDNFDMALFYQKWLQDVREGQNSKSGDLPYISPRPFYEGESDVAWSSGYHLMLWYFYREYGDEQILEQHYNSMKEYVRFLGSIATNHILPKDRYGDWLSPNATGWWTQGMHLSVTTGYYYYVTSIVAKTAKILGRLDDELLYLDLQDKIKAAYNKRFFDAKTKQYENGSQFANSFPLFLDIVPEGEKEAVLKNLVDNIFQHKGHLSTGILGTKYMMEALWQEERSDIGCLIAGRKEFPGWLDMIKNRTTLSESWNPVSRSNNHVMFGSIDSWFYKALAGIDADDSGPGFEKFVIKPAVPPGMTFVKANRETVRGRVSSEWELKGTNFELDVAVPVNSTATVFVPATAAEKVTESGTATDKAEGITYLRMQGDYAVFSVLSGQYHFVSKDISKLIKKPFVENPEFELPPGFFKAGEKAEIKISTLTNGAEIRYTLDGGEPNANSTLYAGPFVIDKSSKITAKAFKFDCQPSFNVSVLHQFIDAEKNGLNYDLYEGAWHQLPDFETLTATNSGHVFDYTLDKVNTAKFNFGLVFKGYINIAKEGEYTFYAKSNDGSQLIIDNKLLVDNDQEHAVIEKSGKIMLMPGKHAIEARYFQSGGSKSFAILYEGPGIEKQSIPASVLFQRFD
jgi:alpha-L-rhamnosidase